MTRFDAADATERRKLFADAVRAHRERGSAFCTVEAARPADELGDRTEDGTGDETGDEADAPPAPWVQFAERTFNLDCTDAELERLTDLLDDYPDFRVERMDSPEDAEGTNVRVTARSDVNRLAAFVDRTFREVYERPSDYRAWVVQV